MRTLLLVLVLLAFLSGLYVYAYKGTMDFEMLIADTPAASLPLQEGLQSMEDKTAKCPNVLVKDGEYLLLYNSTDTHNEMPIMFRDLDEYVNYIRQQRANGLHCPVLFLQKENDSQGNDVFRIQSTPFNDYYNEPFAEYIGMTLKPSDNGPLKFPLPMDTTKLSASSSARNVQTFPFYNIEGFSDSIGSPQAVNTNSGTKDVPGPSVDNKPLEMQSGGGGRIMNRGLLKDIDPKGGYSGFDPYGMTVGKYTTLDRVHDSTAASPFSDNPMDPNWGGTQYTKDAVDSGKYIENNVYPVNYSMPGGVQFYPGLYQTYPDPPNFSAKIGESSGVRGGRTIE